MARSNKQNKTFKIALSIGLLLVVIGTGLAFIAAQPSQISKLTNFPVDTYMSGKKDFGEENYKLSGRVDNVLLRSDNREKLLISVQPKGSKVCIPILLAKSNEKVPIQREQKLLFQVSLGKNQEIVATQYIAE